jgi:hypothetical protein
LLLYTEHGECLKEKVCLCKKPFRDRTFLSLFLLFIKIFMEWLLWLNILWVLIDALINEWLPFFVLMSVIVFWWDIMLAFIKINLSSNKY